MISIKQCRMNVKEIKKELKKRGHKGYSKLKKNDLLQLLQTKPKSKPIKVVKPQTKKKKIKKLVNTNKILDKYIKLKFNNNIENLKKRIKVIKITNRKQKEYKDLYKNCQEICWGNIAEEFIRELLEDNKNIIYVLTIDGRVEAFIIYYNTKKNNMFFTKIEILCSDKERIKDKKLQKLNMGSIMMEICLEHSKKIKSNIILLQSTDEGYDFYKKKFNFTNYKKNYYYENLKNDEDEDNYLIKKFSWTKKIK